jgi:hypothetical protein
MEPQLLIDNNTEPSQEVEAAYFPFMNLTGCKPPAISSYLHQSSRSPSPLIAVFSARMTLVELERVAAWVGQLFSWAPRTYHERR